MLARSASGPGLSINTGTANSLFGSNSASASTSQPPASGSLFGGTSKPGGLFGSTTTAAPTSQGLLTAPPANQPSGGLFGQASNPAATSQTGGLFGPGLNTSQPQQSSSLFGSLNTTTQPQQSGNLFGNSNTASQPQQAGGLFGQAPQQAQNQASGGGGLFGSSMAQQPAQSGGLFGGLNTQNQPRPATSLFGNMNPSQNQQQQQQQPQQSGGLFGSLNQQPAQPSSGLFGNSLGGGGLKLGQSQAQQTQQSVPGVRIDMSNMRATTRFNDLHEDLQKELETYDKVFQAQQARSADINAVLPSHGEQLSFIPDNVDFLSRKLLGVETTLESDAEAVALVQGFVKTDIANAQLSVNVIHNQQQPQMYQQNGTGQDLVAFFSQEADEMAATLSKYQSRISEIESHLRGVEASTMQQAQALSGSSLGGGGADDQMRELTAVLREFEQGILGVAGEVGAAREGVQQLQFGGYLDVGQSEAGRTNGNGKRSGIY